MKYVIVGKNMEVTDSLKDAVTQPQQDTSCVENNSRKADFSEPPRGRGSPLRANKGTSSFGSSPTSDSGQRQ